MRASATRSVKSLSGRYPIRQAMQQGVSLVELMVGMALGLMLLTGVISVTVKINASSAYSVKMSRLHQQMRSTMDFMVKDLQRAGYVNVRAALDNCSGQSGTLGSASWSAMDLYECVTPVIMAMGEVLPQSVYSDGSDCVLYSYDLDGDGGRSTTDFELFGFKLAGGAVRTRSAGNSHSCDSGTWQALSDAEVVVTALLFRIGAHPSGSAQAAAYQLSYSTEEPHGGWYSEGPVDECSTGDDPLLGDKCVWRRTLTIELAGHLADDPEVSMSLTGKVTLRNDRFQREATF